MKLTSSSQAGHDLFAAHVLGYKRGGSFVDFGCAHPVEISNSYALETQLGWRGLLLDISPEAIDACKRLRQSRAICADATTFDFEPELRQMGLAIDYASIDCDEVQVAALKNFLGAADRCGMRFRVLTVETDRYRFGDDPHREILRMLTERGYDLIADDVKSQGCPYETFWVSPKLVDMKRAEPFRSTGLDWQDVLKKGGAL